jgi:hypothetical protein
MVPSLRDGAGRVASSPQATRDAIRTSMSTQRTVFRMMITFEGRRAGGAGRPQF